jgi:hypothetical protein
MKNAPTNVKSAFEIGRVNESQLEIRGTSTVVVYDNHFHPSIIGWARLGA